MAYKLTDKVPTKSGYYWAKINDDAEIVEADIERDECWCSGQEFPFPMSVFSRWSERIEEPTDKDEKTNNVFPPQIPIHVDAKIPHGSMVREGPMNIVNDCDLAEMRRKGLLNDPFINTRP
jgi:hypothetical protein